MYTCAHVLLYILVHARVRTATCRRAYGVARGRGSLLVGRGSHAIGCGAWAPSSSRRRLLGGSPPRLSSSSAVLQHGLRQVRVVDAVAGARLVQLLHVSAGLRRTRRRTAWSKSATVLECARVYVAVDIYMWVYVWLCALALFVPGRVRVDLVAVRLDNIALLRLELHGDQVRHHGTAPGACAVVGPAWSCHGGARASASEAPLSAPAACSVPAACAGTTACWSGAPDHRDGDDPPA